METLNLPASPEASASQSRALPIRQTYKTPIQRRYDLDLCLGLTRDEKTQRRE